MSILVSQDILNQIQEELSMCTESIFLVSAFCKLPLVKHFDACISDKNIEKTLIVRFRPEDIRSGASDLSIYPYCRDNGWKLFFRLDLHAKTYVFDRLRCIVGSANATNHGLNIGGSGNYEIATTCNLSDKDVKALELLLLGSVEMNDSIYDLMNASIQSKDKKSQPSNEWPKEITELFVSDYSILFSEDFPGIHHYSDANTEDLLFLNIATGASLDEIKQAFLNSKCYQWLLNLIKSQETKEMYFGAVSANLHNTLLDDPKPYRKDIKQLLTNLLCWIEELDSPNLKIDRPNYSQRIRYIERNEV